MTNNEIVSYFMKDDENDKDPYYDSLVIPTYTMHPIPVPQESDDDEMQHDEKNRPKIENPAVMQQMQQEKVLADQEHAAKMEEIDRKNQLSIAKFNAALRKIQLQEREAKETENASV